MTNKDIKITLKASDQTQAGLSSARKGLQTLASEGERAAAQMRSMFGSLGLAVGGGFAVKSIAQMADQFSSLQARLKLASRDVQEFNAANTDLVRISRASAAPLAETATLYTRIASSVKDLGVSQSQIASTTEAVALSLRISGASAGEASSAMLQFSQAIASGVLRGEEFNAVNESAPRLLQALAKSLQVPVGELREMAKQGQLTRDVLINGLMAELPQLQREAAQLPQTIGNAFTGLQNKLLLAVGAFDKLTNATGSFAGAVDKIGTTGIEAIAVLAANVAFVFNGIGRDIGGIAARIAALGRGDFKAFSEIGRLMKQDAQIARRELDEFEKRILGVGKTAAHAVKEAASAVVSSATTNAVNELSKSQIAAAKERATIIERYMERELNAAIAMQQAMVEAYDASVVEKRIDVERQLADEVENLNDLYNARALAESDSIKSAEDLIRSIEEETELLGLSNEERERTIALRELERKGIDLTADALDEYKRRLSGALNENSAAKKSADAAQKSAEEWKRAGEQIEQSLTDALMRGFESGKGFAENLRDTLKNLFNTLILRPIIQPIAQSASGSILGALGMGVSGTASAGNFGNLSSLATLGGGWGNIGGSLLGGIGSAASAGLFSTFGGAGAAQAGMLAAQTAGFGSFGTASTLSSLGASGAGSAIGALGTALPWIGGALAIASALGLFKKKPSNKSAWGDVDLDTGTTSNLGNMTGKKQASQQTMDVRTALLTAVGAFGSTISGMGGTFKTQSITAGFGERDGVGFAFDGVHRGSYGNDPAEALATLFRELAGEVSGLEDGFKEALLGFEGSAEEYIGFVGKVQQAIDVVIPTLEDLGMNLDATGWASKEAAIALLDLMGGLEGFTTATAFFVENFYSDVEKLEMMQKSLADAFASLDASVPATRDAFREMVEAQDLTTEAGRQMYVALMGLSPAFVQASAAADQLAASAQQAALAAEAAAKQTSQFFVENFYSDAEKLQLMVDGLGAAFTGLGLTIDAMPTTLETFRALVEAQDTSTESGERMRDALLNLAPAFVQARSAADSMAAAADSAAQAAKAAADAAAQAAFEARAQQAQAEAAIRNAATSSARPNMIAAAREAQSQAEEMASTFGAIADNLRSFRLELLELEGFVSGRAYDQAQRDFTATATRARLGDREALGNLAETGRTLLEASLQRASTRVDYLRDVALVSSATSAGISLAERQKSIAELQLGVLEKILFRLENGTRVPYQAGDNPLTAEILDALSSPYRMVRQLGGNVASYWESVDPKLIDPLDNSDFGYFNWAHRDSNAAKIENRRVADELRALREETAVMNRAMVQSSHRTAKVLAKWDVDGQPDVRTY